MKPPVKPLDSPVSRRFKQLKLELAFLRREKEKAKAGAAKKRASAVRVLRKLAEKVKEGTDVETAQDIAVDVLLLLVDDREVEAAFEDVSKSWKP